MVDATFIRPDEASAPLREAWAALAVAGAEACAEVNVFAHPDMLLPAMAALDGDGSARLAIVNDDGGSLIGVMPVTVAAKLGRFPLRTIANWTHANSFLSPICVAAGQEAAFWSALIPALANFAPNARTLMIDALPEGGPIHAGLLAAARALGLPGAVEQQVVRAMLAPDTARERGWAEAYWDAGVRPKKRKELRRQWNRLNDEGVVAMGELGADEDVAPWINEFLSLEASGWKGANGSAIASQAGTEAFFRAAILAAHARGGLCFTALRLDGRAIAMLLTLINGSAGFSFKTAFDEVYARYSPGVLLQRESLNILGARRLEWIDSCAAQDHPMIDSLWHERRSIVGVSCALPGTANRIAYGTAQAAMRIWHAIKPRKPSV
ncbi:MAG: GNAT family N-acetyltransferase [Sphingopyxis sp.]